MQGVTVFIAAIAVIGILAFPLRYSVPIWVGALAWYPSYVTVSLGTVDLTVGRIAVGALLVKAVITSAGRRKPSWAWVDLCVAAGIIGECIAGAFTSPNATSFLENRAGAAFDRALPYIAVRLLLQRKEDYIVLLKSLLVIMVPLALLGAYECLTGYNPVGFLYQHSYAGGALADRIPLERRGLYRADVTFGISIIFGLFLAMVGPLCTGLWGYVKRKAWLVVALVLMAAGMLSSMSSGPLLAGAVAGGVLCLYPVRKYWKIVGALFVIWVAAIDMGSNRHWYGVLGDFTLSPNTAWYRVRLMEVAFGGGMSGHWLAGFGLDVDPGWGPAIDGRGYTDIVNHYVLVLVGYGLLGLLPLLGAAGGSLLALRRGYVRAAGPADRWLVWGLLSSLTGILAAMFSVSLMGQVKPFFFVLLAVCVNAGTSSFTGCPAAAFGPYATGVRRKNWC